MNSVKAVAAIHESGRFSRPWPSAVVAGRRTRDAVHGGRPVQQPLQALGPATAVAGFGSPCTRKNQPKSGSARDTKSARKRNGERPAGHMVGHATTGPRPDFAHEKAYRERPAVAENATRPRRRRSQHADGRHGHCAAKNEKTRGGGFSYSRYLQRYLLATHRRVGKLGRRPKRERDERNGNTSDNDQN